MFLIYLLLFLSFLLVAIPPRRLTDESNSGYVILPRKGEVDEEWMPSGTRRDRKDKRKSKKERKKSFVGIKVNNLKVLLLNYSFVI